MKSLKHSHIVALVGSFTRKSPLEALLYPLVSETFDGPWLPFINIAVAACHKEA